MRIEKLKELPNWVFWRYTPPRESGGRKGKRPMDPHTGKSGSSTDSRTWATYEEAVEACKKYKGDGVGFVFTDSPFVGLDLDDCFDGSTIRPEALNLVERVGSYAEKSPSGKGLHIIAEADLPEGHSCKFHDVPGVAELEIYSTDRFFTFTGQIVDDFDEINPRGDVIRSILEEYEPAREKKGATVESGPGPLLPMDDLLKRLRKKQIKGRTADRFRRLYFDDDRKGYPSDSEAAQALLNDMCYFFGGDPDIMLEVFLQCPLGQRPDAERKAKEYDIPTALRDWNRKRYDPNFRKRTAKDDFDPLPDDDDIIPAPVWPVVDDKGNPVKVAWENTAYLLEQLGISCRYNLLTKSVNISGHELDGHTLDGAATAIRGLAYRNGMKISRNDLFANLDLISERNAFSPVREYLKACRDAWDGRDYLEKLFKHFHIDPTKADNMGLYRELVKIWFVGAVRMAFNEGQDAMQGVLILQGPQGIGKTRFVAGLVPDSSWTDSFTALDPSDKDDLLRFISRWIVELGEFGETLRKEKLDKLKQFITQPSDTVRHPYARTKTTTPRTTAAIGTVNGGSFLKDGTGERRYWVIPTMEIDPVDDMDLCGLWGQVMHLAFDEKIPHWLTAEQIGQLNNANEPFKKETDEERALWDILDWEAPMEKWKARTSERISQEIGYGGKRLTMIGKAIRRISEQDKRVTLPTNNKVRLYHLPPVKDDDSIFG